MNNCTECDREAPTHRPTCSSRNEAWGNTWDPLRTRNGGPEDLFPNPPLHAYGSTLDAEAAYEAHVAACGGYPTLPQSVFYSRVVGFDVPIETPVGLLTADA